MFKLPENLKQKAVLLIGSNNPTLGSRLDKRFENKDWRVFRLDNTSETRPDIVASYTSLESVGDGLFDAVCVPDLAQRLFVYETVEMFKACKRVLKENGIITATAPDLYIVADHIIKSGLEGTMFSTADKTNIRPYDFIYGLTSSAEKDPRYNHKSGYAAPSFGKRLLEAGFVDVKVKRSGNRLFAEAVNREVEDRKTQKIMVLGDDVNDIMRIRDNLIKEPKLWNGEEFRKAINERN